MTYRYLLAALLVSATLTSQARVRAEAGPRIDVYTSDSEFASVLVDDIRNITYIGSPVTGYTAIKVTTYSGNDVTLPIEAAKDIVFNHVDTSVAHEIDLKASEHGRFALYLNFNDPSSSAPIDPDKPYGWRGGKAGNPVFFNPFPQKGYTVDYAITGKYTGFDYLTINNFCYEWSGDMTAAYGIGLPALYFPMPYEPIILSMTETEIQDYAGLPILGTYQGARIGNTTGRFVTGRNHATLELKANTTMVFNSGEGDNNISQLDCYTYNEENKSFTYVPDPDDVNKNPIDLNVLWTMSGSFDENGLIFMQANYVPDAVSGNRRHYVLASEPFAYTIADADDYSFRRVMEVKPDSKDAIYYLLENYNTTRTPMTAEFTTGSSMADVPSQAYLSVNGNVAYRYTHLEGQMPEIVAKGVEAGTYTGDKGDLVLDGFGTATFEGLKYDYTIDGAVVTLLNSEGQSAGEYTIDSNAMTYKGQAGHEAVWEGPMEFITETTLAAAKGGAESEIATVSLTLDRNPNGTEAPGQASVKISIPGAMAGIHSVGAYVYDDVNNTITVANIPIIEMTGTDYSNGNMVRRPYVFHIAADKKSAYLGSENIGERLYVTWENSYVVTGQSCTLKAVGAEEPEQPAIDITGDYTGAGKMVMGVSERDTDVKLTLAADNKATFIIEAMGQKLINSEATYTFADNVLTLKGVKVGAGQYAYETKDVDLTFNYVDGTFVAADAEFYGDYNAWSSASGILLKLNGCVLTIVPVE